MEKIFQIGSPTSIENMKTRMRKPFMDRALAHYIENSEVYRNAQPIKDDLHDLLSKKESSHGVCVELRSTHSHSGVEYLVVSLDNEGSAVCLFSSKDRSEAGQFMREEKKRQLEIMRGARNNSLSTVILGLLSK